MVYRAHPGIVVEIRIFFLHLINSNCLKLSIPGYFYNLILVSCGDIGIQKICIGQVFAWIVGLRMPLLPLGPSCPLQTILLSDLVGRGSPLQTVVCPTAILVYT
jgi:hypothetical protein